MSDAYNVQLTLKHGTGNFFLNGQPLALDSINDYGPGGGIDFTQRSEDQRNMLKNNNTAASVPMEERTQAIIYSGVTY